jgi:transposase InsO family protein
MRGRRPAGPEYVDHLQGSPTAKERLKVVLETLAGTCRVEEACARLGICPQRFHQVREEALTAALAGLEPGVPGRPAQVVTPEAERVRALEAELAAKDVEIKAAQARAEIATTLPKVLRDPSQPSEPAKKKAPTGDTPPAPAAWQEHEFMNRLQQPQEAPAAKVVVCNRRGPAKQRRRRDREQRMRHDLVVLTRWAEALGLSLPAVADLLNLAPRTLRHWRFELAGGRLQAHPLGRPTLRAPSADRNDVIALIDELGPRIGVPTLQACFPAFSRAELTDLLCRYRRVWRARHQRALHVLHWLVPGSVWAMDFAEPPSPIDGLYPYLLAVRDLASGQQLAWLPLASATAEATIAALLPLFLVHGMPLVLKADNGSPFIADLMLSFLEQHGVLPLFSPPRMPQYNGSAEAGVGSMKSRTEEQASREGHPTEWTWHNTQTAPAQANATARPRGHAEATADELWRARPPLSSVERRDFQHTVDHHRRQARYDGGWPLEGPLPAHAERAVDRQAIARALVEHGFLFSSRRPIPLPFPKRQTANNR